MKTMPLFEVADCIEEIYSPSSQEITLVTPEHIGDFGQLIATPAKKSHQFKNFLSVKQGDVLFAKSVHDSKVVFIQNDIAEFRFSTKFINLRPNPKVIDPNYLNWYLRSRFFQLEKKRLSMNGLLKDVRVSFLESVRIPVPDSIAKQNEVTTVLDRVAGICLKINKGLSLIDNLILSEFITHFGSPLTNTKRLPMSPVSEMAQIYRGNSTSSLREVQRMSDAVEKASILKRYDDSLLVTKVSEMKNEIGKVKFWKENLDSINRDFHLIPKKRTNPFFLYCQFLVGQRIVRDKTEAANPFNIDQNRFEGIKFLDPCKSEQDEFGNFFSKVQKVKSHFLTKLEKCSSLISALSQRGFN